MKKKMLAMMLCAAMVATALSGCGQAAAAPEEAAESESAKVEETETPAAPAESEEAAEEESEEPESAEEDEENYETGDASQDNPRNQDEIGENEILVVSFGTSYNDSRRLTIGAIEEAIEEAFPDWSVRRAFTSQTIIDHVKDRDGEEIDNVTEALDRAAENGVKNLVVQPTHLMDGYEYTDLRDELQDYADRFEQVVLAEPLLTSDEDYQAVMEAIVAGTAEYDDGETAICFMGHGTEAESNQDYAVLQELLTAQGHENYYISTVEATPTFQDVVDAVTEKGIYKRAVLEPLMVVAGDHANNDMAGDEEDSWKSMFLAAGFEVETILEGLGQNSDIQKIYVAHTRDAVDKMEFNQDIMSSQEGEE